MAARSKTARNTCAFTVQEVPVRAEIVMLDQLSAHAGRSELLRWLSGFSAPPRQHIPGPWRTHRRSKRCAAASPVAIHWPAIVPAYLQRFDLDARG